MNSEILVKVDAFWMLISITSCLVSWNNFKLTTHMSNHWTLWWLTIQTSLRVSLWSISPNQVKFTQFQCICVYNQRDMFWIESLTIASFPYISLQYNMVTSVFLNYGYFILYFIKFQRLQWLSGIFKRFDFFFSLDWLLQFKSFFSEFTATIIRRRFLRIDKCSKRFGIFILHVYIFWIELKKKNMKKNGLIRIKFTVISMQMKNACIALLYKQQQWCSEFND